MSYLSEILKFITSTPMTIDEILEKLNKPKTKTVYVIHALKEGIKNGVIKMEKNPHVKTLYSGHKYYI